MRPSRARRRLAIWLAVLAILTASLAPSVSHALDLAGAASWTEVCTSQGAKRVQEGNADADSAPAASHGLEHCPYCSVDVPALGAPPAAGVAVPRLDLKDEAPRAFLAASRTLHAWLSAQPRAPPRFS